ncbi:MAG: type II toxin-antitoxin system RelE/ParE family toxin [bacterium]|nr:type II toxin-antitoxin system RelE/ParE family toxin [Acidimicrobiia bacterium]MCY4648959.1 type II toxin-antitoxin system RelE/ParE family toxin [bacterium]
MPKLTNRARKDLNKLSPSLSAKAREMIKRLDEQPSLGKKLLGPLQGKRSARLGRTHRIIYTLVQGDIVVLTITARKDAYR